MIPARACCPLHAIAGFAPDRHHVCMQAGAGTAPSLADATPKQSSAFCTADRSATQGLYETIPAGRLVVVRDARVLTMRDGKVLGHHDVAARDGRIEAVNPGGGEWPADAIVIDGKGKTLIPGLSDIHVHIFTTNWAAAFGPMIEDGGDGAAYVLPYDLQLFQLLANGITRVEVMAGCPDTLWMRDQVRAGTLVGPRLSVGSPLIDGAPSMHSPTMSYIVGDRAGGKRAAALIAEMGFDFAKPYSRLPADSYEGLMAECDRRGIRAMGHVPIAVGVEAAVVRGQGGIAHSAELFYNELGPERDDPSRIARLTRLMADAGVWLQATVVVTERMKWRLSNSARTAPDVAWMNPLQQALWAPDSPLLASINANRDYDRYYDRTFELSCLATSLAREAGVRILTGTDYTNPHVVEGFSLHEELALLTGHCGLTPHDALFASTRQAAIYHSDCPADGTIAAGGVADLVLLDRDPLADIHATRAIDTVITGSTLLRRASIHEGLARIRATYEAMPKATVKPIASYAVTSPATT
jgi:cytosine/adenosine deaminase-related metal-dependent hydrolase